MTEKTPITGMERNRYNANAAVANPDPGGGTTTNPGASTGAPSTMPVASPSDGGVPAMPTNPTPGQADAWFDYYIRPEVENEPIENPPVPTGGSRSSSAKYGSGKKSYEVPTLPSATSQADYINSLYDANRQAQEANLRAAYEANLGTLDYTASKIPGTYNAAADQAAAQAAINRQNFNEYAAANGLNTGAGAQARLSQGNAAAANIASVRRAQAEAEQELNFQRSQMETQYRNAISEALAQNDLQRAQALYEEAKRVDESLVNTAANQANLDWTVWNAIYNRR